MRKYLLVANLGLALGLVACEQSETVSLGVLQANLEESSKCTESMLDWQEQAKVDPAAAKNCAGGWQYQQFQRCPGRGPECGSQPCIRYKDCQHEAFGWTQRNGGTTHFLDIKVSKTLVEASPANPGLGHAIGFSYFREKVFNEASRQCNGFAVTDRTALEASMRGITYRILETPPPSLYPDRNAVISKSRIPTAPARPVPNFGCVPGSDQCADLNTLSSADRGKYSEPAYQTNFICGVNIRYEQINHKAEYPCECLGLGPYPECSWRRDTCGSETLYTASHDTEARARELAQERDSNPPIKDTIFRCMSLEDKPVKDANGNLDVTLLNEKARQLVAMANGVTVYPAYVVSAARNKLNLLYEFYGDRMDDANRAEVKKLRLKLDCGIRNPEESLPSCLSAGSMRDLTDTLIFCRRLMSSHVPAAVIERNLEECIGLVNRSREGLLEADTGCRDAFTQTSADLSDSFVERAFAEITCPGCAGERTPVAAQDSFRAGIRLSLRAVDVWYRKQVGSGLEEKALYKRLTGLLAQFWNKAYREASPLPKVAAELPQEKLTRALTEGLWVERQVLLTAFADAASAPIETPPLLWLVADSFKLLSERLADLGLVHDLGCRFLSCSDASPTEVSALWYLLGHLHDEASLREVTTNAAGQGRLQWGNLRAEYKPVFAQIVKNYTRLRQALSSAVTGTQLSPEKLLQQNAPVNGWTSPLKALVERAAEISRHFRETGLLLPGEVRDLHEGMDTGKSLDLFAQLGTKLNTLEAELQKFERDRNVVIETQLNALQNAGNIRHYEVQYNRLLQEYNDLSLDRSSLRTLLEADQIELAGLTRALDQYIADNLQVLAQQEVQQPLIECGNVLTLSGSNARFQSPNQRGADLTTYAVGSGDCSTWMLHVEPGDRITLDVTGQWSPTCALRYSEKVGPDGEKAGFVIKDAATGPAGYLNQWDSGQWVASSNTHSFERYTSNSSSNRSCFSRGLSGALQLPGQMEGVPVVGSLTGSIGKSWEDCEVHERGVRDSTGNSSSDGVNSTASLHLTGGLGLKDTPFPDQPAGSLLLVGLNPGASARSAVQDLFPVYPAVSYVFDRPMDLYLVVNDAARLPHGEAMVDCEREGGRKLTVNMVRTRPMGGLTEAWKKAVLDTITEFSGKLNAGLGAGSAVLTQGDLQTLRDNAYARLADKLKNEVGRYPALLLGYFNVWVDKLAAQLERKVQIVSINRQMEAKRLEIQQILDAHHNSSEQSRVHELLGQSALRNLAPRDLRFALQDLVFFTNRYVFPTLLLRYDQAIQLFLYDQTSKAAEDLALLINSDFNAPVEQVARDVKSVITKLYARTKDKLPGRSNPIYIALAFQNPDYKTSSPDDEPSFDETPEGGTSNLPNPNVLRTIQVSRSSEFVWQQIKTQGVASFVITPTDLYSRESKDFTLRCNQTTPVVEEMAIFAVRPGLSTNEKGYRILQGKINPTIYFPDATGTQRYSVADRGLREVNPQLIAGDEGQMLEKFKQNEEGRRMGIGISPFGTYNVEFLGFTDKYFDETLALVLLFKVDVLMDGSSLGWLKSQGCSVN